MLRKGNNKKTKKPLRRMGADPRTWSPVHHMKHRAPLHVHPEGWNGVHMTRTKKNYSFFNN